MIAVAVTSSRRGLLGGDAGDELVVAEQAVDLGVGEGADGEHGVLVVGGRRQRGEQVARAVLPGPEMVRREAVECLTQRSAIHVLAPKGWEGTPRRYPTLGGLKRKRLQ